MKELLHYHDLVNLSSDGKTSTIEIIRVGKIYGRGLTITEAMLDEYIKNFEEKTYRTEIQVNLRHDREGEAAGWIKKLYKNNGVLFAEVEWTPLGVEKVTSKQFRYTSSELSQSYIDPVTGRETKNVLIGVALTNIPQVKGMAPVSLSEESPCSSEYLSFYNSIYMKEKAKGMYADLMKKDKVTKKELSEFAAACKDSGMPEDEMADMKKKLKAKCSELSEENKEEEKQEETKEEEKSPNPENMNEKKDVVELSEFNKVKKLAEQQAKLNIQLQERLDRQDLKEEVETTMCLSEEKTTGFINNGETVSKVVNFMIGLSREQRKEFSELLNEVRTVDLSVRGSSNAAKKSTAEDKADVALAEANKRAEEKAKNTGRSLADCLAEEYAKLDEANA